MDPSYAVRSATMADAPAITDLVNAAEQMSHPQAARCTADDIVADWHDLELDQNTWLVVAPDGALGGYATLAFVPASGRYFADAYTHPDHLGRGIGTDLLVRTRAQAEQTASDGYTRLVLTNHIYLNDLAQSLLERHGYQLVRVYHDMRIDLDDEEPAPAAWPAGLRVRTCDGTPADIRRAYECIEDSFVDHWGRVRREYDQWSAHLVQTDFDPSLWFFAEATGSTDTAGCAGGGTVVGAALCRTRGEIGVVHQLGVIRSWRRRGVGEALLRQSFSHLHRRGLRRVELGVDGSSLTGADRLYRRVGMRVVASTGRFEIELRPGTDLLGLMAVPAVAEVGRT